MYVFFNPYGNEKQYEVCRLWNDKTTTDIVYGGSKGSGKSFLGCSLILADALSYDGTFYFIARKNLTDLRKFTIPSIMEVLTLWNVDRTYYKLNGQDNYFQFFNGSRVYLIEASYRPSDPMYMRFGSMQMTRGWIEEAGEFDPRAKSNLQATIGRYKNDDYNLTPKLLQTCNPSKNYLYTDYYKPFVDGVLPSYMAFVQALPTDNKRLPSEYLDNLQKALTPNEKQRLLYGKWEFDDNPNLLVSYDAVCDCFTNSVPPATDKPPCLSADLAMKGRDRFVAVLWQGNQATIKTDTTYSTAKDIEQTLQRIATDYGVGRSRIVADSDGLGAYLADYLQGIKAFHGGASAVNKAEFANIKSECAFKLAEKINARQLRIICNNDDQIQRIKDELMLLIAESITSDTSKRKLISKDEMKRMVGHSPDYLDALLMGMYFDIQPESKGVRKFSTGRYNDNKPRVTYYTPTNDNFNPYLL